MSQFDTTISIMLFEGGAIINALRSNTQGQRLADKIELADRTAFNDGKTTFDLSLDPIEVGMAIDALEGSKSGLSQSLGAKLKDALAKLLVDHDISYGGQGAQTPTAGTQDAASSSPTSGLGEPAPIDESAAQPSDPSAEQPAQEQPATDSERSADDQAQQGPQTP